MGQDHGEHQFKHVPSTFKASRNVRPRPLDIVNPDRKGIYNAYSYDVSVPYTIKIDGVAVGVGPSTVWSGNIATVYEQVSPARVTNP